MHTLQFRLGRWTLLLALAAIIAAPGLTPAHAEMPNPDANPSPTNPPASDQEITLLESRPDRVIATLPNRMVIIAQRVPVAPVVSAQVWVKTGSIYEQEHVGAGLSHFLEHLLSGGTTTTRSETETNAILGRIGARVNAATSLDNVHYYINTTADHSETAIDLLSDWMQNSVISETEYQRERDVIQREFSMGEGDPNRIFWKLTQQARYAAHPARHPTIGYLDEFLTITRDEIYDFYKRMYVPNNMVFVVSGDIDPQATVQQIAQRWQDVPAGELPDLSFPVEPELTAPRTLEGRAAIARPRLRLAWPGTQIAGEGDYALDLLAMVLGQGESSRLVRTVRDEQGLVTSVVSYNLSFPWGRGFFGIDSELADGVTVEQAKAAMLEHVQRLREQPVSEEELNRAKRKVLADVLSANQTAEGIASRLARDTIGMADPDCLSRYAERIQAVTAEQLQAAAERFLEPDRLITVALLPLPEGAKPERLTRPEEPSLELPTKPIDNDNAHLIEAMRAHLADKPGAAGRPIEVGDLVEYRLDNGLRLLVQRSTLVPAVAMQMYWKGGLLGETPGREGVANATAMMMMRGTETRTAAEIAEAIENLGAGLSTQSGNNTTYAQARALKEDWPQVMELMADVILRPSFPEDEWQRMQPRLLAAIDRQKDSWIGELSSVFREVYYGDHPWSQTPLGRKDVVASLSVDDLRAHHAQELAADEAVIAVVGDVDPEQVRGQVAALFGGLAPRTEGAFTPPAPTPPAAQIEQVATRKPVAAIKVGLGPTVERAHRDYADLQVLSRLMSNFPTGWLDRALRGEGPGLVYAAGAYHVTGLVPGYFDITFNTAPAAAPEALRRAMAVVERAKTGRITDEDLARAKAKVLTDEFFGRQSNSSRAMEAALDELYGVLDPEGRRFMQRVEAITADDIRAAAERYLVDPVVVVLTNEPIPAESLDAAVTGEAPATQPAR